MYLSCFILRYVPRFGNGLEGRSKVSSKNLRILIYGHLNHIHIHGGIFWVKTRKIYQFSTCTELTYLSSSATMVNFPRGPQAWRRPQMVFFIFISFLYWKTNSREKSQLCKKRECSWYPGWTTQNAPGLMTTGSDSILTTRDEVTLGSVLQKKIKSAEWKRKKEKKSLMSEIYIVQAFPPINFGSPWVFPGKFNLRVSEPFTLNSPRRRCFVRVICCPRSPLNLVHKGFLGKRLFFFFLEMKLCFSRLKGTWKWTLNSELLRRKTERGSSFRFPTQGALVLATSQ